MGYTHGERWTEEKVLSGIKEVIEKLQLNRMPSRKEIEGYYKNYGLTGRISRTKGFYGYAEQIGLTIKDSETSIGKAYESIMKEKIASFGYQVMSMPQNFPYDLLVNKSMKVDVKASKLHRGEMGRYYSFNISKPYATCDIYFLLSLSDSEDILNEYIIPSHFVWNSSQISIGEHSSKYNRFIGKWEYLKHFAEFSENINRLV